MQFGDNDIFGSTENVNEKLNEVIFALNGAVSELIRKQENDYPLFALRGLGSYTLVLFDRLISHQDFPIEYIALSARNLFECYLLTAYIIKNPSKAEEFIGQKAHEELEINEGFLSLTTANTPKTIINEIQVRMDHIRDLMKNHGLTPSKNWNVNYLAEQTNNRLEYKAFFKLYSKYVHPSSWIVNSVQDDYGNPVFKSIFFFQGQHYASCITKIVSQYLGNRASS